jgi:hypothetical protein
LLSVQLRHSMVVQVLAASHRVCEVNFPAVAIIHIRHCRGHATFGHDGVSFAEEGLADESDGAAGGGGFDGGAEAGAAGADDDHVVFVGFVLVHEQS